MIIEVPKGILPSIIEKGYYQTEDGSLYILDHKKTKKAFKGYNICPNEFEYEIYKREREAEVERNIRIQDYKAARRAVRTEDLLDSASDNIKRLFDETTDRLARALGEY